MKRIFLDTNFIIDFCIDREDGNHKQIAQNFLACSKRRGYRLFITYLTIANLNYILRKYPADERTSYLKTFIGLFEVISNTKEQIYDALALNALDFEDALQYVAAKEAKCDFIITRDKTGFSMSDIPVYSPSDYIDRYF